MGHKGSKYNQSLASVPVTGNREQLAREEKEREREKEKLRKKGINVEEPPPPPNIREILAPLVNKDDDPNTIYKDLVRIGQGASGSVYVATDSRTDKKVSYETLFFYCSVCLIQLMITPPHYEPQVAIKQMEIDSGRVDDQVLLNEVEIMKEGQGCTSIVQFIDCYIVPAPNVRESDKLWVPGVLPYHPFLFT